VRYVPARLRTLHIVPRTLTEHKIQALSACSDVASLPPAYLPE
jgi:hypothetical protein